MSDLLLRLRPYVPPFFWRKIARLAWNVYWSAEARRAGREGGALISSLRGSERAELAECLFELTPFSSLLEVGCAYGQNFHTLAPLFPHAEMVGIDADKQSIESGALLLSERGIGNVRLQVGSAEDLGDFADKSIDVVIAVACLMYVRAERIEKTVSEMLRVARQAVLLVEQHEEKPLFPEQDLGTFVPRSDGTGGYWVRDYKKLFQRFLPAERISISKIPSPLWTSEQWESLGCVIDVRLEP